MNEPNATPVKNLLRQPVWLLALATSAFIVCFHIYFWQHAGGFWRDEVNLINLASHQSLSEMAHDSFPVLMPLLVKACGALGLTAENSGLRFLGTGIGLGIIAGLWLVAWVAHRSPPLLGLALLGLNSTFISYGDSLRAYGLGSLWVVLLFATAVMFLRQSSWKRAGLVACVAVLSVQTLFHDAVFVGTICLGVAAVCARRRNWLALFQILAAGFVAALSLLPYFTNLMATKESSDVLRTGLIWPRLMADLTIAVGFPWQSFIYVWAGLAGLVIACAVGALLGRKSDGPNFTDGITQDEVHLFAGTTLVLSVAGYLVFLWMTSMPGQPWYFLPIMALVAACFDATISTFHGRARVVLLVGALFTTVIAVPVAVRDLDYRFTNIDRWSHGLTTQAGCEDFIVVLPWFCGITFDHYFHGETPWTTIPPLADHATARYDLVHLELQKPDALKPILERISAALQAGHRVWLLAPVGALQIPPPGNSPPHSLPPAPLPGSGWADEPYSVVWAMQTMQFLSSNSRQFSLVENPDRGRHIAENMELFMAEGWREKGRQTW